MEAMEILAAKADQSSNVNYLNAISLEQVVLSFTNGRLQVLLAKDIDGAQSAFWRLPGTGVRENEHLDQASKRLLSYFIDGSNAYVSQLKVFGDVSRVPNRRQLSIAHLVLVPADDCTTQINRKNIALQWFDLGKDGDFQLPEMLYDHEDIVRDALSALRHRIKYEPIGFHLLPNKFTLLQLQELYEAALNTKLDKPNFRRKVTKMQMIIALGEKQQGVAHRAAELYRFDAEIYEQLRKEGFMFEV